MIAAVAVAAPATPTHKKMATPAAATPKQKKAAATVAEDTAAVAAKKAAPKDKAAVAAAATPKQKKAAAGAATACTPGQRQPKDTAAVQAAAAPKKRRRRHVRRRHVHLTTGTNAEKEAPRDLMSSWNRRQKRRAKWSPSHRHLTLKPW